MRNGASVSPPGAAGASSPRSRGRRLPARLPREQLEELCEKTKLTQKEVRALYSRFRRLAPNGVLTKEQFRQTMGVLGVTGDTFIPDRMFKVFDADQDEKLSFQEFATSLAIMIRGTEDEKLRLSFDMTAGQRGAAGIKAEDFHRLIQACNTMTSSLIAPTRNLTNKEDVDRLFHDLSSDEGGALSSADAGGDSSDGDGEVITLEAYKAAAQHDELFLQCLGLRPSAAASGHGRRSPVGTVARGGRLKSTRGPSSSDLHVAAGASGSHAPAPATPSLPPSTPSGCHVVTQAQLEELRERVARLQVLLQDPRPPPRASSLRKAPSPLPESDAGDDDERWWTPLSTRRVPALHAQASRGATQVDHACAELDRILAWCSAAESRLEGNASGPGRHSVGHEGTCRTPTKREISRDSSTDGGVNTKNVHKLTAHEGTSNLDAPDLKHAASSRLLQQGMRNDASRRGRKRHRLLGPKKGLAVHFGHEDWNMVLSMMIGIRMAVGRSRMEAGRELQPVDFLMKEKFSIIPRVANIFDSEVSKRVTITRFIDYAPLVFQRIRTSFGIQHDDFLRSVGPEQLLGNMVLGNLSSLAELSSEGKSGAFFYYTADGNYMLKTVAPKEFVLLKRMLKPYYDHIFNNHGTLLVRFLGLHCLSVRKKSRGIGHTIKKLYFVVMANMFNTPFDIHRRYDLKGSWVGRQTPPEKYDPSVALKDVDFQHANECIRIGEERKTQLLKQLELDAQFLAGQNIIDYSLLLGIHELTAGTDNPVRLLDSQAVSSIGGTEEDGVGVALDGRLSTGYSVMSSTQMFSNVLTSNIVGEGVGSPIGTPQLPMDPPLHRRDAGGMLSQDKKSLYFLGVIDILTPYDTFKVFEHNLKGLRYDRQGVSCCPPPMYAERFMKFMKGAIV